MRDIVIFDLDGTLALIDHRRHFVQDTEKGKKKRWDRFFAACVDDEPNGPVIELARRLSQDSDLTLLCFSGRSDQVRAETEAWINTHIGPNIFSELRMRPEGNYTPDDALKEAWVKPILNRVLFTVDDRDKVVAMWRARGLTCLQVAPGDF